jgi:hypothetical protein
MRSVLAWPSPFVAALNALVFSIGFAACGRDQVDSMTSPPRVDIDQLSAHVGDLIVVEGFFVIDGDGPPTLCSALAESYPPQCAGTRLPITQFDVTRLTDRSTNADAPADERVVWTDDPIALTGELASTDGNFRLDLVTDELDERAALLAIASSGPHCPVESTPPDPSCAARAVANATIELQHDGDSKVSTSTDALGVALFFGSTGNYVIVARPVAGLLGTPEPLDVRINEKTTVVQLSYDTGIR